MSRMADVDAELTLTGDDRVSLGKALHALDLLDDEDLTDVTLKAVEWFEEWLRARSGKLAAYVEGGQPAPDPNREPRRWPPNSPEPDVKPGFEVRSAVNGVVFRRDHWGTWVAQPPMGDGHPYDWSRLNSEIHAEGGMELIEVVEGGQVDGQ